MTRSQKHKAKENFWYRYFEAASGNPALAKPELPCWAVCQHTGLIFKESRFPSQMLSNLRTHQPSCEFFVHFLQVVHRIYNKFVLQMRKNDILV